MVTTPVWAGALRAGVLAACVAALPATGSAQVPGPPPLTGNPTPGTEQPAPPRLADRVTLTGCVRTAPPRGPGSTQAAPDANTPSDSRYVLVDVQREKRVPPGAGTSSAAAAAVADTYRLAAIESALSPFVGAKVEISGQIEPPPFAAAPRSDTPTLRVEFVQRLSKGCV